MPKICHLKMTLAYDPMRQADAEPGQMRVELFARASEPIYHYGYQALLVNDFSSMTFSPRGIPINYNHESLPIGRSERIWTDAEGLHIDAILYDINGAARDTMAAIRAGIPEAASIEFRDYDAERYLPGQPAYANGRSYESDEDEIVVVRDWVLSGCAITPEPYDLATYAQEIDTMLSFLRKKEAPKDAAPAPEETPETLSAPAAETAEAAAPVEAAAPEAQPVEALSAPAPEMRLTAQDVAQYVAEFGNEKACAYIAQGLSLDAARLADYAAVKEALAAALGEVKKLTAKVAELEDAARDSVRVPQATAAAEEAPAKVAGLSMGASKLYHALHINRN